MGANFEVYVDKAGMWRWTLRHDNGNIIADSAQGYASRENCMVGLNSVKTNAPSAPIVEKPVDKPVAAP